MQQRGKLKNRLGSDFGRPLKGQILNLDYILYIIGCYFIF